MRQCSTCESCQVRKEAALSVLEHVSYVYIKINWDWLKQVLPSVPFLLG